MNLRVMTQNEPPATWHERALQVLRELGWSRAGPHINADRRRVVDRAGIIQIGPQSAGAVPGPVCYRQGGTEPTVTDANLVLGRIGKENPIGRPEGWEFDLRGAEVAIQEKIGSELISLDLIF